MGVLLFSVCSSVHPRPDNSQPPYIRQAAHTGSPVPRGLGLAGYDQVFRQQTALDLTCQWNELNISLFAATVICSRLTPGTSCSLCQEADHHAQDCALGLFQHLPSYTNNPPSAKFQQHLFLASGTDVAERTGPWE